MFNMKKNLLVISPFAPYKTVKHAGGQIHYYYIKKLESQFNITLISYANITEKPMIEKDGINGESFILYDKIGFSTIKEFFTKVISTVRFYNPFDKYGGMIPWQLERFILKTTKNLRKNCYNPDFIIFDWIQTAFFSKKIKKLFPNSKIISVEQDVCYLNFYRRLFNSKNFLSRVYNSIRYRIVKNNELNALALADEAVVLNKKDEDLLNKDSSNIKSIRIVSPYYHSFANLKRSNTPNKDILFYGAMNRMENYEAAIWFIENVVNELDSTFNFVVIGNKPPEKLMKYESDHIKILGFVEDISPYFENSLCLVVPLLVGAGIKIKVLEGLSAGIPVLTNDIGIEGIPAKHNYEYLHCTTTQEYLNSIMKLAEDTAFSSNLSANAKLFMNKNFNYETDTYLKPDING